MRVIALIALAITCSAALAFEPLSFSSLGRSQALCFGREYSEDFLRRNPLHALKQIKLKFYREPYSGDSEISLSVQALVKDRSHENFGAEIYSNVSPVLKGLKCDVSSSSFSCEMECNGRKLEMNWSVAIQSETITFQSKDAVSSAECGPEMDLLLSRTRNGAASLLELYPLPEEFCQL